MNTVKQFMKARNMNVTTLSTLSKVPYATVHELVNDVSKIENCKSKTLFAIAEALNITVDDLLRPRATIIGRIYAAINIAVILLCISGPLSLCLYP